MDPFSRSALFQEENAAIQDGICPIVCEKPAAGDDFEKEVLCLLLRGLGSFNVEAAKT